MYAFASEGGFVGAACESEFDGVLIYVDSNYAAAGGFKQLNCNLAYKTESDHGDGFAELGVRLANALHRDRAERRICGHFERNPIGDGNAEVCRNKIDLGVRSISRAGAGYCIAYSKPFDAFSDRRHETGAAVAESLYSLKTRHHLLVGIAYPFAAQRIEDLLYKIGPLSRFAY